MIGGLRHKELFATWSIKLVENFMVMRFMMMRFMMMRSAVVRIYVCRVHQRNQNVLEEVAAWDDVQQMLVLFV